MLGLLAVFVLDATYAAVRPNMGAGISQPGYILNNG